MKTEIVKSAESDKQDQSGWFRGSQLFVAWNTVQQCPSTGMDGSSPIHWSAAASKCGAVTPSRVQVLYCIQGSIIAIVFPISVLDVVLCLFTWSWREDLSYSSYGAGMA